MIPRAKAEQTTPIVADIGSIEKDRAGQSCWSKLMATAQLVVISSGGMFADGYDLTVINLVLAMQYVVYPDEFTVLGQSFAVTMTFVGVILGQLSFGVIADLWGRKPAALLTSFLVTGGTVASACCLAGCKVGILYQLGFCRFLLGVGIGGEYPVGASIAADATRLKGKTALIGTGRILCTNITVFYMGAVASAVVVVVLLRMHVDLEVLWRVALLYGAVPSLITLVVRTFMEEHVRDVVLLKHRAKYFFEHCREAVGPKWKTLCGICLCWFLFNSTSYQTAYLFLLCDAFFGPVEQRMAIYQDAFFAMGLYLLAVSGCIVAIWIIPKSDRRQLIGLAFGTMSTCMLLCGMINGRDGSTVVMLSLFFVWAFPMSWIPATCYIVSAEQFPPSVLSTCVGFGAACGKLGAMFGSASFPFVEKTYGVDHALLVSGCLSLAGMLLALALIPRHAACKEMIDEPPEV